MHRLMAATIGRVIIIAMMILLPAFTYAAEQPEVGKHVVDGVDAIGMIISLAMVLLVIVIAAFILKRFQGFQQQLNGIKIITSVHLGNKEKLVVVEVSGKQLLLGVTAQQINLLDTLASPITSQPTESQPQAELPAILSKWFKNNSK